MNMDVAFLLTLFILFVALLASPIFLPKQKAAEEKNLTPLFEESCVVGRDFGSGSSFAHNMFLWRVSLYPEFMVLALFSRVLLPYREIERVEIRSFTDYKEVWIRRSAEATGELITVRSKNVEKMIEAFASAGVRCDHGQSQSVQRY